MDKSKVFKTGDTIKVSQKIKEGKRERVISYEGVVLKKKGQGNNTMFTLRQTLEGIVVDRIIPLSLPTLIDIKITESSNKERGTLPSLRKYSVNATNR